MAELRVGCRQRSVGRFSVSEEYRADGMQVVGRGGVGLQYGGDVGDVESQRLGIGLKRALR
jgi:hypothetical protein